MGVCCSKDKVVKIKETTDAKPEDRRLLIQENVGPGDAGKNIAVSGTINNGHERNPHIPVIEEPQGVQTQEAEAVNTYNKEDDSAIRSTLIFPSYTGYRNQDPFGISKKNSPVNATPTALVSPFQSNSPHSLLNPNKLNSITPQSSPLPSRYSPMLNTNRDRRQQPVAPKVFERRLANSRRGSVESGGFDSDLESSENEETQPNIVDLPNIITSEPILPNPDDNKSSQQVIDISPSLNDFTESVKPIMKSSVGIGTDSNLDKEKQDMEMNTEQFEKLTSSISIGTDPEPTLKVTVSAGTETDSLTSKQRGTSTAGVQSRMLSVKMVDASVGTDSDDFYRSKKSRKVQIDPKKKKTQVTTSSASTGTTTNLDFEDTTKKVSHDMNVGTDPMTSESAIQKSGAKSKKKEVYVKMVDASVGTDSDDFYRSKKSRKVQIDPKKKKSQVTTSSASTGTTTDLDFEDTNKKVSHDMNVGTDPLTSESAIQKSGAKSKKKEVYVKVVDACVGTNSDDFYRSKKGRKVQVSSKNTASAVLSTGIGTSTEPSPKPKPKISPRIVREDTETPPPVRKRTAPNKSPTSTPRKEEKQEKPHPIIETLENAFTRFARYGNINYDGKEMNNKNWAKLCRDCEFIDNKHVLVGEIDVIFSRHKPKGHRLIDFEMFKNCLNEVADKTYSSKIKDEWTRRELVYRNVIGKAPELIGITGTSKTGNVVRMTDHTLYPVSHKMRFDEEGRGTGIDEKFEIDDTRLGYVQGYKDRDTYDSKMLSFVREKSGASINTSKLSPRLPRRPVSSGSNRS